MADTQTTTELKKFMKEHNLETLNHVAIAELLMKQQEQIEEIAKEIVFELYYRDSDGWAIEHRVTLFDKWNCK